MAKGQKSCGNTNCKWIGGPRTLACPACGFVFGPAKMKTAAQKLDAFQEIEVRIPLKVATSYDTLTRWTVVAIPAGLPPNEPPVKVTKFAQWIDNILNYGCSINKLYTDQALVYWYGAKFGFTSEQTEVFREYLSFKELFNGTFIKIKVEAA